MEAAQRISTTGLENGTKLEDVQETVGYANLSTRLCDRHRCLPTKSATLIVNYAPRERERTAVKLVSMGIKALLTHSLFGGLIPECFPRT